jgi:outer membrane protein OmpA-like peptidoglycan-associated protein
MTIVPTSRNSVSSSLRALLAGFGLAALVAGCVPNETVQEPAKQAVAPQPPDATPQPAPASALPPLVSFDEAIVRTTHAVFSAAPAPEAGIMPVVIDPLIDGASGYQSRATQSIQDQVIAIVKRDFPRYAIERITPDSLRQQPRVLVGTFTPVNAQMKMTGPREAYWFCLVLLDLKSGKIVARSVVRVRIAEADATPTASFSDSPAWLADSSIQAYVANCQGSKVGDAIDPAYFDGLATAALISEAEDAYDQGRYAEALALYTTARKSPAGDQLRVYNGIYLSLFKLGRTERAAAAFRELVDYGFRKQRLAVKFLFRSGSVRFVADSPFSATYDSWLQQIAAGALASQACLQITGHTTPVGPAAMNDSLSLLRAEYIQSRLEEDRPALKHRTVASGVGSRQNIIGTGRDDASDALDRRVELKPINPCS